jgi:hypothetical protein
MSPLSGARRRLRSRAVRAALVLAAAAAVLAATAIQPLAASAQTLSVPHPGKPATISARPKTRPGHWSAATAKPAVRRHPVINLTQARQQAIAQAAKTEKTAGYRVSPAVLNFLSKGLGLRLEPSVTFTGVKSGATLKVSLSAPEVSLGLPAGIPGPRFSRTAMTIDPATGAISLTAGSADGTLRVAIPDGRAAVISSAGGLSSDITLRVPVLGQTAALSGRLSYPARGGEADVGLSGHLPAGVDFGNGTAELSNGATVTLSTADGLRVLGAATLGRPGHQLDVTLSGAESGEHGWTFGVSGADGGSLTPLPGLALAPGLTGSLTVSARGTARFDVHGRTARPWSPLRGVSVSGNFEFSNIIPNERVVPAPGISGATPWAAVDGIVTLASGATASGSTAPGGTASGATAPGSTAPGGTASGTSASAGTASGTAAPGAVAVNLVSGRGVLTGGGTAPVRLAAGRDGLVLDQAGFRGGLTVGADGVSGSVLGTGRVTLTGAGRSVTADSALTVTPAGSLVLSFPADRSILGLGTPGHEDMAYWASAATRGFTGAPKSIAGGAGIAAAGTSGVRLDLPAGLSATTPGSASVSLPVTGAGLPGQRSSAASVSLRGASAGGGRAGTLRSGEKNAASADAGTGSYTLSSAVYSFLTGTLNIPLGSATLSGSLSGQTLTVGVAAPTALPSSLPGWIPNPSYASAKITVDEATGTLTLTAATGTNSGLTGTLTVTVADASSSALTDGTDVTGSLALADVPFAGGSTASLTFSIGYTGSALSASLAGSLTSTATFASGVVTIPAGATLTLASGTGLSLSGTADISAGSNATQVTVGGTLTDLKDWSLTVGDANAPLWQPAAGLTVTPDFSGTVSDTAGTVGFDLASAGSGPVATWVSPDSSSTVSVCGFDLSNQSPSGTTVACGTTGAGQTTCTTSEVTSGDLWLGIAGAYSYAPASIELNATGCLDLTARSATISTAATGNLTGEFGSGLPFSVTQAALTATVSTAGKFSLTGTAAVVVTQGVSGDPLFHVGVSLSDSGIVAGVQVPLDQLGLAGTGSSGELYVSTATVHNFDPASLGLSGTVIPKLPAGLTVSFSYAIPSSVITALQKVIPGFPGAAVTAMASLSTTGFTINAGVVLGTGLTSGGFQLTPGGSAVALYLDSLNVGLAVGETNEVSLSGTGYAVLPPLAPGGSTSSLSLTVGAEFNIDEGSLMLDFNLGNVSNAFGVSGFNVQDFGGSIGVIPDNPSLQLYADNIVLPGSWAQSIGMVQGSQVSFDANISVTQPALMVSIQPPAGQPGQPALEPLSVDPNLSPAVVQSFTVGDALFELAPFGGTDPGTGAVLQPGVSVIFDATIASVRVHVDASVNLSALSVNAYVSVGAFQVGPVQVQSSYLYLNLSPTEGSFGVSGGVSWNGDSFYASFGFAVGTSADGASAYLYVEGGLPSYFQGGLSLNGDVTIDGTSSSINASGSGWFSAGGATLGPVSFYVSFPGSLSWQDFVNSITQIAQFFVNAGTSFNEIWTILQQVGYDTWDIFNALGSIGQYGQQIEDTLASAFGFSTTYYDIWTWTSSAESLVLDVGGGSQSPNAGVDTWYWNNGYNQDWMFVQSPYSGWYEIVNRGSGQCLSVYGDTASWGDPLVQYPCFGGYDQLWYMGSINLATTYVITSALDSEVVDVQNAYPWAGGTVDQYPYNGGNNQQFWLTNSGN